MNELSHYGVPGMKWGVRKERKSKRKPLSTREKLLVGSLVATASLAIGGGLLATSNKVRSTQYKIQATKIRAWVENIEKGSEHYQNVSPEQMRNLFPGGETFNVAQQFVRNREMLNWIKRTP